MQDSSYKPSEEPSDGTVVSTPTVDVFKHDEIRTWPAQLPTGESAEEIRPMLAAQMNRLAVPMDQWSARDKLIEIFDMLGRELPGELHWFERSLRELEDRGLSFEDDVLPGVRHAVAENRVPQEFRSLWVFFRDARQMRRQERRSMSC
jgi:hypothetical protein